MNWYWYDHSAENNAPSKEILSSLVSMFQAVQVRDATDLPADMPFVCFAHPGNGEHTQASAWEGKANPSKGQFVALLGFGSDPVPTKSEFDGVVGLPKRRLEQGVVNLNANTNLKKSFVDSCTSRKPAWKLLLVDLETDNLVAFYLIKLANTKGIVVPVSQLLMDRAYSEYKDLARHFGEKHRPQDPAGLDRCMPVIAGLLSKWHSD